MKSFLIGIAIAAFFICCNIISKNEDAASKKFDQEQTAREEQCKALDQEAELFNNGTDKKSKVSLAKDAGIKERSRRCPCPGT